MSSVKRSKVFSAILFVSPAFVLIACTQVDLGQLFQRVGVGSGLAISPGATAVEVGHQTTFSASGGVAPYAYSVLVLAGSAGGTIVTASGVYTAPLVSGTDTVRVTDASGETSDAPVIVAPAPTLTISPSSLTIGVGNTYQFAASGGVGPYVFSKYSGAGSITASGLYQAPASQSNDFITVTDRAGATSTAPVAVKSGTTLTIAPSTESVPEGATFTFTAYGGTVPYLFSVTGNSISSDYGSIGSNSGTYTAGSTAAANAAVVAVDDSAASTQATANVDVVPAAPSDLAAKLPTPNNHNKIILSWVNNSPDATAIEIERKSGPSGPYSPLTVTALPPTATTYTDSTVSPNIYYEYRVYATAASGTLVSPYSNEAYNVP